MLLFGECFALQANAFSFSDLFSIFFKPGAIQSSGVFSLPTAQSTEKDLSSSCVKLLNATSLGKKYLAAWSNEELQGYCKFLKEFPSGLGNAVINVMKKEWYTDSLVKQAVELDSAGDFKNFFKRGHPMTIIKDRFNPSKSKKVDGLFDVGSRENYIKARVVSTELRKWEDLKNAILSEAEYFKYSPLGGRYENTIVIELRKGTKLDSRALQQAIFNAYKEGYSKSMINVTRVGIYNTKKDTVLLYDKEDYEWNARTVKE